MSKSSEIREELEGFSDDQLRDQLRDRELNASGRRTVIVARLVSAISKELEALAAAETDTRGQSENAGSIAENPNPHPEFLPLHQRFLKLDLNFRQALFPWPSVKT